MNSDPMPWALTGNHVHPVNDLREHSLTGNCWCDAAEDGGLIVHNSMDRREFYERGERKPS